MKQIIFTLFTFVWLPCAFFEVTEKPTIDNEQTSDAADPKDSEQIVSQKTPTPESAVVVLKPKNDNPKKPGKVTTATKPKNSNKKKPKEATAVIKQKNGKKEKPKQATTVVKPKSGNKTKSKKATTVKKPKQDNRPKPEQATTVIDPEEDNLPKSEPVNVIKPRIGNRQISATGKATGPVHTTAIKPNKNVTLPKSGPTIVIKPKNGNLQKPATWQATGKVNTTVIKPNKSDTPPKSGPAIVIKPKGGNLHKPQQATVIIKYKNSSSTSMTQTNSTKQVIIINSKNKSQVGIRNRTKADGTLNIPHHTQIPIYCTNCDHCVDTPPRNEHIQRRDPTGKSYCYTKQFMDKGLLTIKRGAIRPDTAHFDGNLHVHCPFKSFQIRAKDQWCFCKTHDCNENRMEFDGIVKSEFSSKTKSK